tara:strand:+ start:37 stop:513 length:477 start_codon:yes stop_codon:yes gene_type:complete
MEIIFTKGNARYGHLKCVRNDGTFTETQMPEQGVAPHDMIHFVVEKYFAIKGAFYGQLKAGADISFKLEHNEVSREIANKIDVWQTESMVESLQSLLWSGEKPDYASFQYMTEQACFSRNMPVPKIEIDNFETMTNVLLSLNNQWKLLEKGQYISVEF